MDAVSLPSDSDGSDNISLPSVGSDIAVVDDNNVDLPDSDSCCNAACLEALRESQAASKGLYELKMCLQSCTSKEELMKIKFDCLRRWQSKEVGWRRFCAWGIPLCGKATCEVLQLSHKMHTVWCKHLGEGFREPPTDQRKVGRKNPSEDDLQSVANAHLLFTWLYEHVAEVLAESSDVKAKRFNIASPELQAGRSAESGGPFNFTEVRWLAPGTSLTEMLDLSSAFIAQEIKPSYSTFCRVYHRHWQAILKTRSEGQHSKCADCCRLKELRKLATSPEDVARINQAYGQHLQSMFQDRLVDAQWCQIATSTASGAMPWERSVLNISMDAMDVSKFKVPRLLNASKQWEKCWRPELTFQCCLAEGISESYFLSDTDICKDSNLQHFFAALHQCHAFFSSRQQKMPAILRLHSDNAASEGKNQFVLKTLATLIHRQCFREVWMTQFRVGHSHWKVDQRFSEVRSLLSNCKELQTPEAFGDAVRTMLKPRQGRSLHVEHINAALDFKSMVASLPMQVSGHVQTKRQNEQGMEAIHSFQLMSRETFFQKGMDRDSSYKLQETNQDPPHPNDVVIVFRQYVGSTEWCQAPMVFGSNQMFGSMEERPSRTVPRSKFTDRQVKEFNKTAAMIALAPWHLEAATTYLLKLVQDNIDGEADHWVAPATSFGLTFKDPSQLEPEETVATLPCAVTSADLQFANRAPAPVNVRVRMHKKTRPAAHELPQPSAPEPELPDASDGGESEVFLPDQVDDFEEGPGPPQNPGAGCPQNLRGRRGAPARVAHLEEDSKPLKRPAAGPVKAKAQPKRRCLSKLPFPDGAIEALNELKLKGHTKCRSSKFGCAECRKKVGLVLNEDETAWQWKSEGR